MDRKLEFNKAVEYYGELFPHISGKQKMVSEDWKRIKIIKDDREFLDAVKTIKDEWKKQKMRKKTEGTRKFFAKVKPKSNTSAESMSNPSVETLPPPDVSPCADTTLPSTSRSTIDLSTATGQSDIADAGDGGPSQPEECPRVIENPRPKQDELNKEIAVEKDMLLCLYKKREHGLLTDQDRDELKSRKENLGKLEKKLRETEGRRNRAKKHREGLKRKLNALDEETRKKITGKTVISRGAPPKVDNEELIAAIARIAISGSAANDRRRDEVIRSVKTLDQLTEAVQNEGYTLQRSSVYLRLIPKNSRTREGKRHMTVAPVKLFRAQNDQHSNHPATKFARATIMALEEIAGILGPKQVIFHSQDDKAKVALGLPAANKQSPILMHMEYQIRLPDHDFVVAPLHKLIPSVIGDMQVKEKTFSREAVSYSGSTYVGGIRSAKHSGSSALHHLQDMKRIRSLPEFESSFNNEEGGKPVMIVTVDGGPDENPRYKKTMACAIDYFNSFDLDALFIATNAPGRSAFNRCERRMAPLSKQLAGVILQHEHFGSHLNGKGETIDEDLEIRNFEHAGTILAEVWSSLVLDNNPTVAEYISQEPEDEPAKMSEEWKSVHVRQTHYCLQIVKCNNIECCLPFRSGYLTVVKDRFLPPPIPVVQTTSGLKWVQNDAGGAKYLTLHQNLAMRDALTPTSARKKYPNELPYDYSNPAVDNDTIKKRTCGHCNICFGAINAKDSHQKTCAGRKSRRNVPRNDSIPSTQEDIATETVVQAPPVEATEEDEEEDSIRAIRPVRVKARRGVELLCLMEGDNFEWYDFDECNVDGLEIPPERSMKHGTPVLTNMEPIWSEDQ